MTEPTASALIDRRLAELEGWRGEALARMRALIREAEPETVEEWKWEVPVWSCAGILCTGEAYKAHVKLTFPKGASLPDPAGVFSSSLEGNARRALDIREGEAPDEEAFKALVRAAAELNRAAAAKRKAPRPADGDAAAGGQSSRSLKRKSLRFRMARMR